MRIIRYLLAIALILTASLIVIAKDESPQQSQERPWEAGAELYIKCLDIDSTIEGYTITEEEADLLKRIAMSEAGNQGVSGMWLVMSVVINRVEADEWPDTIKEVIYQERQFASVKNGSFDKAIPSEDAAEALALIEIGQIAPDIIGFETVGNNKLEAYFMKAYDFKDHQFYIKGRSEKEKSH